MTLHFPSFFLAVCLLFVSWSPSSAPAQEASKLRAQAVLRPERVAPGEEAELIVIVQGSRGGLRSPHITAEGLRFGFRGVGDMEFVKSQSGGAITQLTFSYSVAGDVPGVYDIPVQRPRPVRATSLSSKSNLARKSSMSARLCLCRWFSFPT